MRLALKKVLFALKFQPLYCIAEKRTTGFEALIRWNHPTRGTVSPAEFITLAEETGLIVPIGEWVLREACHQASTWPDEVSVTVNVSTKQFTHPGLSNTILQALSASGLAPHRLELEIPESIFVRDVKRTMATLHGLHAWRENRARRFWQRLFFVKLRSFPFDKVKFDRSFVENLSKDGNSHAMIHAITALAGALGIDSLAEGVELAEQFEVLEREDCQFIQGYLFSRPVPADAVLSLLEQGDFYPELMRA